MGMMARRWRRGSGPGAASGVLKTAAALAAAVWLSAAAGCGRAPEPAGPPEDNFYRLPLTDNPVTLDPARFTDINSEGVARRIFNGLLKLNDEFEPVPDLAETWDISPDGLIYTFHLRKGVLFHNGREMVAEDVRYSYERLLRKSTLSNRGWVVEPIRGAWALRDGYADSVSGIETPDPYTVVITLEEPYAAILYLLAMGNAAIVPAEAVQALGAEFGRKPVGTGPFRFSYWRDNDLIELMRNEQYFGNQPALDGLRFRIIKEPLVAYQEYRAGRLEHCAVPPGHLETVLGGSKKPEHRSTPTLSTYYLGITMTREPCGNNLHLRRALNYAVDREFICRQVLGGTHTPARGLFPPGLPGYDPEFEGYSYDPYRAGEELKAAGYLPGVNPPPRLQLFFNPASPGQAVAEAVEADCKRIGLMIELMPVDMAALLDATNDAEPDLFRLAWGADYPDAENFLQVFHSRMQGSAGNRAHYTNKAFDDLLYRTRQATAPADRLPLLREAEQFIMADAPWVFLTHGQTHLLVKPYVRNFHLSPMDVGTSVNQVDFSVVAMAGDRE
jgi:peptide/nickel transport system substrate-binding protein/oligopeptide transport system substrate-binding protein